MTTEIFKRTYLSLNPLIYRVAIHLLNDEEAAKDTTQDVYVKLWASKDKLDKIDDPKSFVIKVTHNLCIDRIRRNNLRIEERPSDMEELPNIGIEDNPVMNRDTLRHVVDCINRMPKKQKEIMLLFVTEALDYKEIAKRTGLTELNVRVTVSRSRNQIKKELEELI
ncbi:MAG: sigma-70 family RNA polymerase sigma factor [Bacteroidales bacterium]|nr:sigma-70 family RNA polymerase sigma factor [Bacteroidales bacterium]